MIERTRYATVEWIDGRWRLRIEPSMVGKGEGKQEPLPGPHASHLEATDAQLVKAARLQDAADHVITISAGELGRSVTYGAKQVPA